MFARVLQRSMRLSASLNAPKTAVASPIVRAIAAPLRSAPTRALHTTRIARAETSKTLGSVHVLDAPAVTGWSEIPAGRGIYKGLSYKETVWKVWYNHAITPLYATIVIASGLMTWFMYRCASARATYMPMLCTPALVRPVLRTCLTHAHDSTAASASHSCVHEAGARLS